MTAFTPPALGDALAPFHQSDDTLALLRLRRSTAADFLGGPGPDAETLKDILSISSRAPDHRRVTPFRFVVFEGEGRARAGDILAAAFEKNEPGAGADRIEKERARFLRAPVVIAVVSAVDHAHRTPEWEQVLTAGAICQNMLIAASAHGFAAQWLTEWYAFDEAVLSAFGLGPDERIAGYIYIGAATEPPRERPRPVLDDLIKKF